MSSSYTDNDRMCATITCQGMTFNSVTTTQETQQQASESCPVPAGKAEAETAVIDQAILANHNTQ
jgi:hypothetical protein